MWSNLALCPSFRVGNTCSALVHCLYGGYNLHWFSDALGLVSFILAFRALEYIKRYWETFM